MLFAFSISAQFICFFQFEEVIRAVIIEDVFPPFNDFLAVFIQLCLDKVVFFRKDRKRTVNIMKFKGGLLDQFLRLFAGRKFGRWKEDPGIDQL